MKYLYIWKLPTASQNVYIIGEEKTPGSRDGYYLDHKCNDRLTPDNKVFKMELTNEFPTDHSIHAILKSDYADIVEWAGKDIIRTREAFTIKKGHKESELYEIISNLLSGHYDQYIRTNNFPLRSYQEDLKDKCINILNTSDECLLYLSTRGGKSFLALAIAKEMICNHSLDIANEMSHTHNILIMSPYPSAKQSFIDIAKKHVMFTGYTYIDGKDLSDDMTFNPDYNIVFVSFQMFDDNKSKIKHLVNNVNFNFIIIDECHNTSESHRSTKIFENNFIGVKKLYISGTPLNDIYSGRFLENQTVKLDFIDLIEMDQKSNRTLIGFPDLVINNVCNIDDIKRELSSIPDCKDFVIDDQFNYDNIFSTADRAETFLSYIGDRIKDDWNGTKNFFYDDTLDDEKHILMFVPSLKSANFIAKLLKTRFITNPSSIFFGYKIDQVSGLTNNGDDHQESSKNVESKYNNIMKKYKKTIFITVDRFTTGVTLDKLDTIFLMQNCRSAERFVQILFRTMTPILATDEDIKRNPKYKIDRRIKKTVKLYNFDNYAVLNVFKTYAKICKTNNTAGTRDAIERLNRVINYNKLDTTLKFTSYTAAEYLNDIKRIPYDNNMADVFTNMDCITADSSFADIINNLNIGQYSKKSTKFTVFEASTKNDNNAAHALSNTSVDNTDNNNVVKTNDNQPNNINEDILKEKCLHIFKSFAYDIIINNIKTFDEARKLRFKDDNDNEYSDEVYMVCQYMMDDNKCRVIDFIDDTWEKFETDPQAFIYSLPELTANDKSTPVVLLEMMWKKFSDEKRTKLINGELTILDPTCGCGAMLIFLKNKGVPADNIYGVDNHIKNVEFCKRLGFKNVACANILDCLKKN